MTERHNHPRLHTLYNKGMGAAQENRNFIIKKLSDYLEVPNNLLLSLIGATGVTSPKITLLYAREETRAKPLGKGYSCGSFARIFISLCEDLSFEISPDDLSQVHSQYF